jgi:hypothetical protein
VTKTTLGRLTIALVIVVLGGWVWALSNAEMPGPLWLVNVALTIVAAILLIANLVARRSGGER